MTQRRKKQTSHFGQRLLLVLITLMIVAAAVLGAVGYAGYRITQSEKTMPNLALDGIPVGNLTVEEVAETLENNHWSGLNDTTLTVQFPLGLSCALSRRDANACMNASEAAEMLMKIGHDADWFQNLGTFLKVYLRNGLTPVILPEPELNEIYIRANIQSVVDRFKELTSDPDVHLDRQNACLSLIKGGGTVSLDGDAIYRAVCRALTDGTDSFRWTEFSGSVMQPDFSRIYNDVAVETKDAYFDEQWNIIPEVVGCRFDTDAAVKLWREAAPGTRIEIPLELFEPSTRASDLEGILYRDRLCFMTTYYGGSEADRIGNIHLAADRLNGITLLPGDVFSYNDAVGERTEEKGYRWAGAYTNEGVTREIGGGVCQVSSTLYCAAMYAQMKTVMRQNHWFAVSYLSMGYDATVSWQMPDYRFKNTRDYPVKIVAFYDDYSITIEFWGTNTDGTHVQPWTSTSEVYDETWGCLTGYSVTVTRNILDANDNIIQQIQEPTGIYHLHDEDIDWPAAKLAQDAAGSTGGGAVFVPG